MFNMFMALLKDGIVSFYISKGLIRHALVLNLTYKEMGNFQESWAFTQH